MTPPRLRISPSGPLLRFDTPRTDDVSNDSTVPGLTASDALDVLYERRIRYLDLDDDPLALWSFDDTLEAVRGPAFTGSTGTYGFTDIYPGTRALQIEIGALLSTPLTPSLILLGAMSVEVILMQNGGVPPVQVIGVGGTAATGLSANNLAWGLVLPGRNIQVAWETGAGTPVAFTSSTSAGAPGLPPVHNIYSVGFSRGGDGVTQPYFNGRVFGSPSGPLALPSDGSAARLTLGARPGATTPVNYAVMSIAIYDRVRPASEWLDSYNRSVGNGLGFIAP